MTEYTVKFDFEEDTILIENDGLSVWVYQINTKNGKPSKDVFLYSPIPAEETIEKLHIQHGSAPILVKEYASDDAFKSAITESNLTVITSGNRDYCVLFCDEPLAAMYHNKKRGYSKALIRSGDFGIPWCENKYAQVFKNKK